MMEENVVQTPAEINKYWQKKEFVKIVDQDKCQMKLVETVLLHNVSLDLDNCQII